MSTWLYQLNQEYWPPERYRLDIWEGERWSWGVGSKAGAVRPVGGDTVVFFYAPSSGAEPGFYGWAVILEWMDEEREMVFRPTAPSDQLKMHPWWDVTARRLADEIRGRVKQKTLWRVPDKLAPELRGGVLRWVAGESAGG